MRLPGKPRGFSLSAACLPAVWTALGGALENDVSSTADRRRLYDWASKIALRNVQHWTEYVPLLAQWILRGMASLLFVGVCWIDLVMISSVSALSMLALAHGVLKKHNGSVRCTLRWVVHDCSLQVAHQSPAVPLVVLCDGLLNAALCALPGELAAVEIKGVVGYLHGVFVADEIKGFDGYFGYLTARWQTNWSRLTSIDFGALYYV